MARHIVHTVAFFVLLAGTARADSIALLWQGSGTSITAAVTSSTVVADVVLTVSSSNINSIAWDISWDDELGYVTSTTGVTFGNWTDFSSLNAGGRSPGTSPGDQGTYHIGSSSPVVSMTQGTATVGTITFHVTANVATDGAPGSVPGGIHTTLPGDVAPNFVDTVTGQGCFLTGGGYCTGSVIFHGASVDVIPEPGTIALLALGLVSLGAVGRRGGRASR